VGDCPGLLDSDLQKIVSGMTVPHCCLANFYVDGYGYQENVLPRAHKRQGHDVAILASTETYVDNKELGYVEPYRYVAEDGIPTTQLAYSGGVPPKIAAKLSFYSGLREELDEFGRPYETHSASRLEFGMIIMLLWPSRASTFS
jgi:hypothetical protein